MKRFLLAAAAATALYAAPAFAADMPVKAPVYKAAALFNWTGFYVGGTIGGIWVHDQITNTANGFVGGKNTLDGVLGGPTVGFNVQAGSFLWGLEGDYSWVSVKDLVSFGCNACHEKVPYFATARLRGGYVAGNSLLYLTGGAAFTRVELDVSGASLGSKNAVGWTIGAGWENSFAPNWSWKIEYLFADFGHPQTRPEPGNIEPRHDLSEHIVRFGLNYRFGGDPWGKGPVVAKY